MIADDDIKLCARALIELFGDEAPTRAAERAEEDVQKGWMDGQEFWTRIEKETLNMLRAGGEPTHE